MSDARRWDSNPNKASTSASACGAGRSWLAISAVGTAGPAGWTAYLSFDHNHAVTSNVDFRRALAHAIDREALAAVAPSNLVVASGGLVPPALQGHTPEIVPRFDPDVARDHLVRADVNATEVAVAALEDFEPLLGSIARSWREVLGIDVAVKLWTRKDVGQLVKFEGAPIVLAGWLPGYQDPEYYLRLLLQSTSRTNEGGFADPAFDILIERARQERSDRERLALFHEADRYAVADRVALIPLVYGRSMAFVKPRVHGWWEFGKTSASFADLRVVLSRLEFLGEPRATIRARAAFSPQ